MTNVKYIEDRIININNTNLIIDSDVAELYGVETKRVNEAVKNNKDKFPEGYVIILDDFKPVENFDRFQKMKHSTVFPKAFTEKGLYMLATILKSEKATETTIAIVETFARIRELSRTITEISNTKNENDQKVLIQKSGEMISEILDDGFNTNEQETTIELNFAVLKLKHTIRKNKK